VLAKASSLLALAPIFGPILGGYLQVAFGWRAAFVALALAGLAVWIAALRHVKESNSQFCTQSGSLAPFPEKAGAAAGLFGCLVMYAALAAGTWVGGSHDGTLLPLATISATVGIILFASARLLARYGKAA